MKKYILVVAAGLITASVASAQDSAKEKIEEILRKIERAGGKNKTIEEAVKATKGKDADYVPNVPGPKERKDGTLARAKLKDGGKGPKVSGQVLFKQKGDNVLVAPLVQGLPDGEYGFHIHVRGDCSAADFSSAGDHFNPQGSKHGGPDAEQHHAGDMGNLKVAGGKATVQFEEMDNFTVTVSKTGVIGRAVIIHEKADDLTTQPTGNAGARIACGVIEHD